MKTLRLLAACGFATIASLSHAQGQTPANAHAFVQAVVQAQPVVVLDPSPAVQGQHVATRIAALDSNGCITTIWVRGADGAQTARAVNWQAVQSVRLEGESAMRVRGRGVDQLLGFESRETAGRVAYALNMVRRACDPVEGYGF